MAEVKTTEQTAMGTSVLKKHSISTFSLFLLILTLVAGGYFGIEDMVSSSGPGLAILILLIFPLFWSIPQALYACELGSALPDEGGYYVWVKRAFGEFWGYQVGWWRTISCYVDSAVYVVLAVAYVETFLDMPGWAAYLMKAGIILFFTWINYRGIEEMSKITSALMIFVLATLAVFVVLGIINWQYNPVSPFVPEGQTLGQSLGLGIALAIWIYSGYESMGTMAGEITNPKAITKATLLTIPAVILLYVLPIIFGLASYGNYADWAAEGGVSFVTIAASYGIPGLGLCFLLGAVACNLSLYNSYLASASRGFFVIANDNLSPKVLCKVNKKHGTPHIAIFSMTIVNLVLVCFDFTSLLIIDVIFFMFAYLVWFLAGIALRIKEPELPRPFKIPGGVGFLITITIAPIIICVTAFFTNGVSYLIGGAAGLLSGPLTYILFKKKYGGIDGVKTLTKGQKKSTALLTAVILVCVAIGGFMYHNQNSAATAYFDTVGPALTDSYAVDEQHYSVGQDSFYLDLTDPDNDNVTAVIWYYQGETSGDIYIGETYDNEVAFAEAAFRQYEKLLYNGDLLMDYASIYNDEYNFYVEYGETYTSPDDIVSYLTE